MKETNKIKIFLVDDHKILRESLELLLSQEDDFAVMGQAENGLDLESRFLTEQPDVLLMDISMPKRNGFDTAKAIAKDFPDIRVIFLTMHKSEEMLSKAFHSGCRGYILKENAFEELATAIRTVMKDEIYVSNALTPISVKTVVTHRANIMRKHNFKNITELVLFAVRNHIIEP